ncbi:MAG: UDP-glucose/GDP-mannose dehydrogenase family protein [Treponema sp.]|nr:UDP-glucose/GDP-mannose dehydrogenase family protein [Treponema sp.]
MKIAIVGYGHVGQAMHKLFENAVIFDEPKNIGSQTEVNSCDAVFVCVPTPQNPDGSCDTRIVESVLHWLNTKIIILRSTVYVGFTDAMMKKHGKEIVFQPEYYGETVAHPFADLNGRSWLSFGGTNRGINLAIDVYKTVVNSNIRIYQADAKSVEMAKYMENSFLALKVTFCNEMYDIANALGADYNLAREVWIADPRIGSSHTFVYSDNRGYGGSCLPKDVASIINQADVAKIDATLMKAVAKKNNLLKDTKDA